MVGHVEIEAVSALVRDDHANFAIGLLQLADQRLRVKELLMTFFADGLLSGRREIVILRQQLCNRLLLVCVCDDEPVDVRVEVQRVLIWDLLGIRLAVHARDLRHVLPDGIRHKRERIGNSARALFRF